MTTSSIDNSPSTRFLPSIFGRLIIGYLIFQATAFQWKLAQGAVTQELVTSCSYDRIHQKLQQIQEEDLDRVAGEMFSNCKRDFNIKNKISPKIKEAVDKWLEVDLENANGEQRWQAYQKALMSSLDLEKNTDREFEEQCLEMETKYESFREETLELADYVGKQDDWFMADKLGDEDASVNSINDSDTRNLINYAQYTLFCSAMVQA